MIPSEYLYDGLDLETAQLQYNLFTKKKNKAQALIRKLKPSFNLLDHSKSQKDLEHRMDKINKAIIFCENQRSEALQVLSEPVENKHEKTFQ